MAAFYRHAQQPLRLLAGMEHRNAAAEGVPDEPEFQYVVTNQSSGKQRAHLVEARHAQIPGSAVSRQIQIQPGIIAETVWGIMNSFIGIAQTQTTNLAVVAPGIAEALLATAIGLVAAIPAVVIYNIFARMIGSYKATLGDVAAQVLLLQSRDLDLNASAVKPVHAASKLRVG